MLDERGGFYKIGYSKDPVYRESTLQAEQPLIVLIEAWHGDIADEAYLHAQFASKRIRGEWFALDDEDVYELRSYFQERRQFSNGMTHIEEYAESLALHIKENPNSIEAQIFT